MMMKFKNSCILREALNEQREQNQLCDVIITVEGSHFNAHRAVLAAFSPYFKVMFTSGFTERTKGEIAIDGSAEAFEILLDFIYLGNLDVNAENIYDVLEMACYMQISSAIDACCGCIALKYSKRGYSDGDSDFDIADAVQYALFAKDHHVTKLTALSEKFMEDHFQELKTTEVFLEKASPGFVEEFLSRKGLPSSIQEKQVLEMVVSWLKHDWPNRKVHTPCLLQKVRLGLVPAVSLRRLVDADMLAIPECRELLDTVLLLKSTKSRAVLHVTHPDIFATRSTVTAPIAICDESANEPRIQFYDAKNERWNYLKEPTLPVATDHAMIVVDGLLYVASEGFQGNALFFYCYNPVDNQLTMLPPMTTAHSDHIRFIHLDGLIYLIQSQSTQIQCYDITANKWQSIAGLPRCSSVRPMVIAGNILVYGVLNVSNSPIVNEHSLYVYRTKTNTWELLLHETHKYKINACEDGEDDVTPILYLHEDACLYRVMFSVPENRDVDNYHFLPNVNKLNIDVEDGVIITATVGKEVAQDHIPVNDAGAFRINSKIFISLDSMGGDRFVHDTGIRIGPEQSGDVNANHLTDIGFSTFYSEFGFVNINFTHLTFDPCYLGYTHYQERESLTAV